MPNSKTRFAVYAPQDMIARFKDAAHDRGMSLSNWLLQAAISYVTTHERNSKGRFKQEKKRAVTSYGYPLDGKCFICKSACHSEGPLEAHYGDAAALTLKQSEIDYGFDNPCEVAQ